MSNRGPKKNPPTNGSVEVFTWATHADFGNGAAQYLHANLYGGTSGHAAMQITFPANEEGQQLIDDYCQGKAGSVTLPHEKVTIPGHNGAPDQEAFVVYFSWWDDSNNSNNSFILTENLNDDQQTMRTTVGTSPYNADFAAVLPPQEERVRKGYLGEERRYLAPLQISAPTITTENPQLKSDLNNLKELDHKAVLLENNIKALNLINQKLPQDADQVAVSDSLNRLITNHVDNWREVLGLNENATLPSTLNQQQIDDLRQGVSDALVAANDELKKVNTEFNDVRADIIASQMESLYDEVDNLEKAYNALPDADARKQMMDNKENYSEYAFAIFEKMQMQKKITADLDPLLALNNKQLLGILTTGTTDELLKLEKELRSRDNTIAEEKQMAADLNIPLPSGADKYIAETEALRSRVTEEKAHIQQIQDTFRKCLPVTHLSTENKDMTIDIVKQVKQEAANRKAEANDVQAIAANINIPSNPFLARDQERLVTRGLPPSHAITLPVADPNNPSKPGLNVKSMLAKMRELVDDGKPYHDMTKNCSTTTSAILEAGASPQLKSYFQPRVFGGFATPQQVMKSAARYNHVATQNNGQKPLMDRVAELNPLNGLNTLGAKAVQGRMQADSTAARVGYNAALGAVGLAIGTRALVGSLANPRQAFNNSSRFVNYASNSNSGVLKALAVPAAIGAAIISPLAAVQTAVSKAIVEPISDALSKRESKRVQRVDPFKTPKNTTEDAQEKEQQIKVIKGANKSPAEILQAMKSELDKQFIPALDKDAQGIMNNATKEEKAQLNSILQQVAKRTNETYSDAVSEVDQEDLNERLATLSSLLDDEPVSHRHEERKEQSSLDSDPDAMYFEPVPAEPSPDPIDDPDFEDAHDELPPVQPDPAAPPVLPVTIEAQYQAFHDQVDLARNHFIKNVMDEFGEFGPEITGGMVENIKKYVPDISLDEFKINPDLYKQYADKLTAEAPLNRPATDIQQFRANYQANNEVVIAPPQAPVEPQANSDVNALPEAAADPIEDPAFSDANDEPAVAANNEMPDLIDDPAFRDALDESPEPAPKKLSSMDKKYEKFFAQVEAAREQFGNKVLLVPQKEFERHPRLYSQYAEQLTQDLKSKQEPTPFYQVRERYKANKSAANEQSPELPPPPLPSPPLPPDPVPQRAPQLPPLPASEPKAATTKKEQPQQSHGLFVSATEANTHPAIFNAFNRARKEQGLPKAIVVNDSDLKADGLSHQSKEHPRTLARTEREKHITHPKEPGTLLSAFHHQKNQNQKTTDATKVAPKEPDQSTQGPKRNRK